MVLRDSFETIAIVEQKVSVSVVVRTYNESKHLAELLRAIDAQEGEHIDKEVVVVDSGSTDGTIEIASRFGCKIVHIQKSDFTFGKSLNVGCSASKGDYLVFISGHCIPADSTWLQELVRPLIQRKAHYAYGRQIGNGSSKFSECQLFRKYFPNISQVPQHGFFCNNANAALTKETWQRYNFDEELTGLEDMELARRLHEHKVPIAYIAEAAVFHLHDESWGQVKRRYEREALALQKIMPQVHISLTDFLRYFFSAVLLDMSVAVQERKLRSVFVQIVCFRFLQFYGSYRGNNEHRRMSRQMKEKYFYPR